MNHWLISANPKMYDHSLSFSHYSYIDWRQGNFKFIVGDLVYIYTTAPVSMIQYKCIIDEIDIPYKDIRDDKEYWLDIKEYEKALKGSYMKLRLLEQVHNPKLSLSMLKKNGLKAAPQGPQKIKTHLLSYIDQNLTDNNRVDLFPDIVLNDSAEYEGLAKQILVNKYERSSMAREKCIEHYGVNCQVCEINFEKTYGPLGKDFIHVHHITPLHEIKKEYQVDYINHLVPVCPNCHSMLHRKLDNRYLSINELRNVLKLRSSNS